ncbi:putative Ig domain-containing protein [Herbiconiux sp. YIM B11900]|uniref:putative Ig domain-containing protein n=1 Tax=Herbiconiux sp. YIM B11900 TaxID=3404131 RepID=UPI003F84D8D3
MTARTRIAHTIRRAGSRAPIALLTALAVLVPVGLSSLGAGAAVAAEPSGATTVVSATDAAGLLQDVGHGMILEAVPPRTEGDVFRYDIQPNPDGSVRLVNQQGQCLEAINAPQQDLYFRACSSESRQTFFFVPQNPVPIESGITQPGNQYFYIVSTVFSKCIYSIPGLSDFVSGRGIAQSPQLSECSAGDTPQEYRVRNETTNPAGVPIQFRNILNLAIRYAADRCVKQADFCQVQAAGESEWHRPDSNPDSFRKGSLATLQATGCGVVPSTGPDQPAIPSTQIYNGSNFPVTVNTKTSTTLAHSFSVTDSASSTTGLTLSQGVKDVWSSEIKQSITLGGSVVTTRSDRSTFDSSETATAQPGEWLMTQWRSNIYTLSGRWKFAANVGNIAWSLPLQSSFAVALDDGPFTDHAIVTSRAKKDCSAGPPATNPIEQAPQLTSDPTTCGNAVPAQPVGRIGTTVSVCPGQWTLPAGSTAPLKFSYRWMVSADATSPGVPIPGATGASYTIQPSTRGSGTGDPFLKVELVEVGSAKRLDSAPSLSVNDVPLLPPSGLDATVLPTSFAGDPREAEADVAYSASLIAAPGTGMALSVDPATPLPEGLELGADGTLSGTPTQPGVTTFTVLDAAPGRDSQAQSFTITVHAAALTFEPADLAATYGQPLNLPLVSGAPADLDLRVVDGSLPEGVSLDPATGVLTGTPATTEVAQFTVANQAAVLDQTASFTLTVTDAPAVFVASALPAATVGVPYSATVLSTTGTDPLIGLAADSAPLPDGLSLNSLTGVISGTPAAAGLAALSLTELNGSAAARFALTVAPAAAAPGSSAAAGSAAPASLAATGDTTSGALLLAATAAALLGALVLALTRRRARLQR